MGIIKITVLLFLGLVMLQSAIACVENQSTIEFDNITLPVFGYSCNQDIHLPFYKNFTIAVAGIDLGNFSDTTVKITSGGFVTSVSGVVMNGSVTYYIPVNISIPLSAIKGEYNDSIELDVLGKNWTRYIFFQYNIYENETEELFNTSIKGEFIQSGTNSFNKTLYFNELPFTDQLQINTQGKALETIYVSCLGFISCPKEVKMDADGIGNFVVNISVPRELNVDIYESRVSLSSGGRYKELRVLFNVKRDPVYVRGYQNELDQFDENSSMTVEDFKKMAEIFDRMTQQRVREMEAANAENVIIREVNLTEFVEVPTIIDNETRIKILETCGQWKSIAEERLRQEEQCEADRISISSELRKCTFDAANYCEENMNKKYTFEATENTTQTFTCPIEECDTPIEKYLFYILFISCILGGIYFFGDKILWI